AAIGSADATRRGTEHQTRGERSPRLGRFRRFLLLRWDPARRSKAVRDTITSGGERPTDCPDAPHNKTPSVPSLPRSNPERDAHLLSAARSSSSYPQNAQLAAGGCGFYGKK